MYYSNDIGIDELIKANFIDKIFRIKGLGPATLRYVADCGVDKKTLIIEYDVSFKSLYSKKEVKHTFKLTYNIISEPSFTILELIKLHYEIINEKDLTEWDELLFKRNTEVYNTLGSPLTLTDINKTINSLLNFKGKITMVNTSSSTYMSNLLKGAQWAPEAPKDQKNTSLAHWTLKGPQN